MFRHKRKIDDRTTLEIRNASAVSLYKELEPLWDKFNQVIKGNKAYSIGEFLQENSRLTLGIQHLYLAILAWRLCLDYAKPHDIDILRNNVDEAVKQAFNCEPSSAVIKVFHDYKALSDNNQAFIESIRLETASLSVLSDKNIECIRKYMSTWTKTISLGDTKTRIVFLGALGAKKLISENCFRNFQAILIIDYNYDKIQELLSFLVEKYGKEKVFSISISYQLTLKLEQRKQLYTSITIAPMTFGQFTTWDPHSINLFLRESNSASFILADIDVKHTGDELLKPYNFCMLLDDFEKKISAHPERTLQLASWMLSRLRGQSLSTDVNVEACKEYFRVLYQEMQFVHPDNDEFFIMYACSQDRLE